MIFILYIKIVYYFKKLNLKLNTYLNIYMTLSFEDVFAIRIVYQDMYNDENNIIRELKKELIRSGMNRNEIDDFLVNFYKNYGINIPKETISSIIIPVRRGPRIRLTDLSGNNLLNIPQKTFLPIPVCSSVNSLKFNVRIL